MRRFVAMGKKLYQKKGKRFVACVVFQYQEDCEAVADSLNKNPSKKKIVRRELAKV